MIARFCNLGLTIRSDNRPVVPGGAGRLNTDKDRGKAPIQANRRGRWTERGFACAFGAAVLALATFALPQQAAAQDRTLTFKQAHTGETVSITYMRNGRHDREGMRRINHIFRDWRRNEAIDIDPHLIDILWEAYRVTGSRAPVTVFSAYRSPVTNAALRANSSGVAQNSLHTRGRALDFNLPDVPIQKLREVALKFQAGGVGFYARSGFVHIDTGNVRHWPRLSRQQLANLFPDGKTLHLPADGKPLAGYELAKAEAARGRLSRVQSPQQVASAGSTGGRSLLAGLFGGNNEQAPTGANRRLAEDPAASTYVPASAPSASASRQQPQAPTPAPAAAPTPAEPQPTVVASAPTNQLADAPLPRSRPVSREAPAETESAVAQPMLAALTTAALPRPRPERAEQADEPVAAPSPGAIEAAFALAPANHFDRDLPFAETFDRAGEPRSATGLRMVPINLSTTALRPYSTPEASLASTGLARLYRPRGADLSDLPWSHAATLDTRFSAAVPKLVRSSFSGPAVAAATELAAEPKPREPSRTAQADGLFGFLERLFH